MAQQKKFYTVEEAADVLSLTPADVNQRRERNELRGFRDGANWKFKVEDVEALGKQLQEPRTTDQSGEVLPSEVQAGPSESSIMGTVIGTGRSGIVADSDIKLAGASKVGGSALNLGGSGIKPGGSAKTASSNTKLGASAKALGSDIKLGGSGLKLTGSGTKLGGSAKALGSDIKLGGSGLKLGESKPVAGGSDIRIGDLKLGDSDLKVSDSDVKRARAKAADFEELDMTLEQDLTLDESDSGDDVDDSREVAPKKGSGVGKSAPGRKAAKAKPAATDEDSADDSVELSAVRDKHQDDDVVLGGSGTGSDVTIGGDSGISLVDPSDSGLSLEEPLELAGGDDDSLELGEDDMLTFSDSASDSSDTEAPTELKADDEFLLTPLEESGEEDSESGSQVIALDTGSSAASDAAPTMLGSGTGGGGVAAMLDEDFGGAGVGLGVAATAGAAPAAAPGESRAAFTESGMPMAGGAEYPSIPEAPYNALQVTSLAICVMLLLLTGFMAFDMVRNMWSWNGPYSISSSMMDSIVNAIGW